jgi:hypothetical protein
LAFAPLIPFFNPSFLPPPPPPPPQVQPRKQEHHRSGIRNEKVNTIRIFPHPSSIPFPRDSNLPPQHQRGLQGHQGADLGYSRTGALQVLTHFALAIGLIVSNQSPCDLCACITVFGFFMLLPFQRF